MNQNSSILSKILQTKQAEQDANFKPVEIVNYFLNKLANREQDILIRRFELRGGKKETLESIGASHEITRERVRQLVLDGIKKIIEMPEFEEKTKPLKNTITHILEQHGGIMEAAHLLEELAQLAVKDDWGQITPADKEQSLKGCLKFIINEFFHKIFFKLKSTNEWKSSWHLAYYPRNLLEDLIKKTIDIFNRENKNLEINALLDFLEKDGVLRKFNEYFNEERPDSQKKELSQIIAAYLRVSSVVKQNIFEEWGIALWQTISPRRMKDKIYLLLKKIKKPLHYKEITKQINESRFDQKTANPETVHNELIMDKRFVLVGRGIYALKEWGYKRGTVREIIEEILKDAPKPLTKQEIIAKVLEQRIVQKATIQLALMNKEKFHKNDAGDYSLRPGV